MKRVKKLTSNLASNPIMCILWGCALSASLFFVEEVALYGLNHSHACFYMTFWIWVNVILMTFVDRIAYYNYSKPSNAVVDKISECSVKKLSKLDEKGKYKTVLSTELISGDLILLEAGDSVPHDGVVVKGISYVNQTKITGELDAVLKFTSAGHNRVVQGSIVESDWLIVKITPSNRSSLMIKISKLLKVIERQPAPSEIALGRVISGMTLLFIVIVLSIAAIGHYTGIEIKKMYILDLLVTLLPTTISGLLYTISIHGSSLLNERNIVVTDKKALDAALDVNVAIFDKTGTLTVGQRDVVNFTAIKVTNREFATLVYLASIKDDTTEGESIFEYAKWQLENDEYALRFDKEEYSHVPFSASSKISGCEYKGTKIYKGSISAICNIINLNEKDLPEEIKAMRQKIASACGTPILVARNNEIVGLIHMQDCLQKNIKKQIDRVKAEGIITILMTGDNELTAGYVANKLGVDAYYAEAAPEDKLEFIRSMQSRGCVVAMYGDGVNDVPALAQADIGISFSYSNHHALVACNIISLKHALDAIVDLKNICRKMTIKRGGLVVFSLTSDIAKYFAIVPSLFNTQIPALEAYNIMNLGSVDSAMLASVIWSALAIIGVTPLVFMDREYRDSRTLLWRNIGLYGLVGIFSPFICIKLIDMAIVAMGIL